MSVRIRLLLLTLGLCVPAIVAMLWALSAVYERERAGLQAGARETVRAMSLLVDRQLGQREAMARALAASPSLRQSDWAAFHAQAQAATTDAQTWIVVWDQERQWVNTAVPWGNQLPVDGQPPFALAQTQPELTRLFNGPVTQRPILSLNVPVDAAGRRYNLGMIVLPEELQRILSEQRLPEGWIAAVLDRAGTIVARYPDFEQWLGKPAVPALQKRLAQGAEGFFETDSLEGEPVTAFYSRSPGYGMTFVIGVPNSQMQRGLSDSLVEVLIGAGVLLLLALGAALLLGRTITRPIERLSEAAARLQRGTPVTAVVSGVPELDEVSAALEKASGEIRRANEELEGRVTHAVAEAQQTQAKLLETQKLEAVGRLSGRLAHDFNNLLQTLSMGLQVLDKGTHDTQGRSMIEACQRAVHKAKLLIGRLQSFGRRPQLKTVPVDLRNQLLAMEPLLTRALPPGISLHVDIAPDLWPVETDPTQLELAVLNILFNARDAMPEGGRIMVRAYNLPREAKIGQAVCIEITDTGSGIAPDMLPRIFEPFFTTKTAGEASGLGLAQVYAFVAATGGHVEAHSAAQSGTTLTLFLPRATRRAENSRPVGLLPDPGRRYTVLMVEDDVLVAKVTASALTGLGFDVVHVQNADEALKWLQSAQKVDIVFSDIVMPGSLNGIEFAEQAQRRWPQLPIVLASGYSEKAPEHLNVRLLTKPYLMEDVADALFGALRVGESTPG